MSDLEGLLRWQMKAVGLVPEQEYRFHPTRRWRSDFAFPDEKLLIEVEGGTYTHGRHTRGKGFEDDCEKYNAATELGFRVLRYTGKMIKSGQALEQIERVYGLEKAS